MHNILIDKIRVSGFRGLNDFEMTFEKTTVLTGTNNVGKTSILKALQLALGSRAFLSVDDLNLSEEGKADRIIIDIRIVPVNEKGITEKMFTDDWEEIFTTNNMIPLGDGFCVPIRTEIKYNILKSDFDKTQTILKSWEPNEGESWQDLKTIKAKINIEEIPFFYIEAQRDVVEDMKQRTSYLGKILADVSENYSKEDIKQLEETIEKLNNDAVEKSDILATVQKALEGIDSAMDRTGSKVSITPFAKKIRDLNKNISIQYGELENGFTMDYHGMGTRSWSSLLAFKAFITQNAKIAKTEGNMFFPIMAIEEPEAHLHPNAQKKLYSQINEIPGQKIISTHSPYIAACADLKEIRGLYKKSDLIKCGALDLNKLNVDDQRKIKQKVINTRGEIFFSKALVLFEGETEEEALPILAEKYFGNEVLGIGIDFIGVGGAGNYGPFLQFAEALCIPWYILSDGEEKPIKDLTKAVKNIRKENFTSLDDELTIFIIENGADFEKMLLNEGFVNEIENVIKEIDGENGIENHIRKRHNKSKGRERTTDICPKCNQNIYIDIIRDLLAEGKYNEALDDYMEGCKTKFGSLISYEILKSGKEMPKIIKNLFNKIKEDMCYE